MQKLVGSREMIGGRGVERTMKRWRVKTLTLSRRKTVARKSEGQQMDSVFCLDLDKDKERFLLCGSCDGSVAVVDLDVFVPASSCSPVVCPIVSSVNRRSRFGHKFMVVSCQWYPTDSGMFVTASSDKSLKVWDTNAMRPVETFDFAERLSHQHWSPAPSANPLIAVAAGTSNIALIDLRSGSSLQQLRWHTAMVNTVQWSPRDANILVSGGADGRILVWDVRSAKHKLKALKCRSGATATARHNKHANFGVVNGLKFAKDGLHLLSLGTDQILRVWDAISLREKRQAAVQVPNTTNFPRKLVSFDVTSQGSPSGLTVLMPCDDDILIRNCFENEQWTLHGHYNPVNACVFRERDQQLYSCANDRMLLVWCPAMDEQLHADAEPAQSRQVLALTQDHWSDEDDGD